MAGAAGMGVSYVIITAFDMRFGKLCNAWRLEIDNLGVFPFRLDVMSSVQDQVMIFMFIPFLIDNLPIMQLF